jgi:hypothetical protein
VSIHGRQAGGQGARDGVSAIEKTAACSCLISIVVVLRVIRYWSARFYIFIFPQLLFTSVTLRCFYPCMEATREFAPWPLCFFFLPSAMLFTQPVERSFSSVSGGAA